MIVLQLILFSTLAFIFYQDIIYKAVYWLCFPALAIVLGILKIKQTNFTAFITDMSYGLLFLFIQLLLLSVYFSIKRKSWVNITKSLIGWGDILFLMAISFYLSPVNFIFFYILSLVLVLIFVLVQRRFSKEISHEHIPLAGLQAVLFGFMMIAGFMSMNISFYDDQWIYFLMY